MIRIYCVDDHELILQGLRADLSGVEDLEIVGMSSDARKGLEEILRRRHELDVVLTDIEMPNITGIQICAALKAAEAALKVGYLTYHMTDEIRYKARRSGVDGMIYKNATADEIRSFIRALHSGSAQESTTTAALSEQIRVSTPLTPTERTVLYYLACRGLTNAELATAMHRSKDTVETHRKNIMSKLGLKNTVELVHYAISAGICGRSSEDHL